MNCENDYEIMQRRINNINTVLDLKFLLGLLNTTIINLSYSQRKELRLKLKEIEKTRNGEVKK